MTENEKLDRIAISGRSHRLLRVLLRENPMLETIMRESKNETEVQIGVKNWIRSEYSSRKDAFRFQTDKVTRRENFEKLSWNDYAIIRILDYIDHAGILPYYTFTAKDRPGPQTGVSPDRLQNACFFSLCR
jgi:lysine 2,3-aminomutase